MKFQKMKNENSKHHKYSSRGNKRKVLMTHEKTVCMQQTRRRTHSYPCSGNWLFAWRSRLLKTLELRGVPVLQEHGQPVERREGRSCTLPKKK
jgi:hypothetical protein